MLTFENKVATIIINILLGIWQLLQWIPGLIGLIIFHNFSIYKNEEAHITVLKVNKGNFIGRACFSCGPIIFVTDDCDENTIKHETGHSVQSLIFGPAFHILVSIPSIIRFWIRKFYNKSHEWYLSEYPEGNCQFGAEELGHTKR